MDIQPQVNKYRNGNDSKERLPSGFVVSISKSLFSTFFGLYNILYYTVIYSCFTLVNQDFLIAGLGFSAAIRKCEW